MTEFNIIDRIANDFAYHPANEHSAPRHDAVRRKLTDTARFIASTTPAGREQALALTKLEEAMFWANAAIARDEPVE